MLRAPARLGQAVLSRWRRSLQVRVVVTTLLVSAGVVLVLGLLLLAQLSAGLLDAKTRAALEEANAGLVVAQNQLAASDATDPAAVNKEIYRVTLGLANRGSGAGLFDVAMLSTSTVVTPAVSGGVDAASIPAQLRRAVATAGRQAYTYTRVRHGDGAWEPGLVVGAQLSEGTAGPYQLYYLFPLRQESSTISLVRRTLLLTGVALVGLLAGIAALVTHQVVTPVRLAARTAERLASGDLHERMRVRGEDDLALLATSFNRMAASLQGQISQLEELSRLQRRFVADVSHELRTPLTTVRMAADVLYESRADFPPAVSRSAELLQNQLDRFEALLADLLEISRHDAGAAVLEAEPTDMRELVRRVVTEAEPLAAQRGSRVLLRVPVQQVVAEVDPRRIERILRNLLHNALEHGEGRPVDVFLTRHDTEVSIAVRDHGVGLRPGEAAQVFHRFWRADPARARATGGTGLGLSIALEDAHLHGGRLTAQSNADAAGSTFRLTVPVRNVPLQAEPPDAVVEPPVPPPAVERAGPGAGRAAPALTARGRDA